MDIGSYLMSDKACDPMLPPFLSQLAHEYQLTDENQRNQLIDITEKMFTEISEKVASIRFYENYRTAIRVQRTTSAVN